MVAGDDRFTAAVTYDGGERDSDRDKRRERLQFVISSEKKGRRNLEIQ